MAKGRANMSEKFYVEAGKCKFKLTLITEFFLPWLQTGKSFRIRYAVDLIKTKVNESSAQRPCQVNERR